MEQLVPGVGPRSVEAAAQVAWGKDGRECVLSLTNRRMGILWSKDRGCGASSKFPGVMGRIGRSM